MKFLAVSQNIADPTPFLEQETSRMAQLGAEGLVEQFFLKTDRSGVVLIVEAPDTSAADRQLSTLPLVRNNITKFTVTELTTVTG